MLICAVQCFISAVNILGEKCDKVVDFPKSGHIQQMHYLVSNGCHKIKLPTCFTSYSCVLL